MIDVARVHRCVVVGVGARRHTGRGARGRRGIARRLAWWRERWWAGECRRFNTTLFRLRSSKPLMMCSRYGATVLRSTVSPTSILSRWAKCAAFWKMLFRGGGGVPAAADGETPPPPSPGCSLPSVCSPLPSPSI